MGDKPKICVRCYKPHDAVTKCCPTCLAKMREYDTARREERLTYNQSHREVHSARSKAYHQAHKEEHNIKSNEYRKAHPEEVAAYQRDYRATHQEERKAYRAEYYRAHHDKLVADSRQYFKEHREASNTRRKASYEAHWEESSDYNKQYRIAHLDELNEYIKHWRADNPELCRLYWHARRARIKGNGGSYTVNEIRGLFDEQNGCCFYCGNLLFASFDNPPHREHKIPVSRGGSNYISNIVLSCARCNMEKHTMTHDEFFKIKSVKHE